MDPAEIIPIAAETVLPRRANEAKLTELPRANIPLADTPHPTRINDRIDTLLPHWPALSTDDPPPTTARSNDEKEAPRRAKDHDDRALAAQSQ